MRILSTVSGVAGVAVLFNGVADCFILVGRNGVGRGEALQGPNNVIEPVEADDGMTGISQYFGSSTANAPKTSNSNNTAGVGTKVSKCYFSAGDVNPNDKLPSFYIPSSDRELYENGVKELVSQALEEKADVKKVKSSATPSIALNCEDVSAPIGSINCRLCMYNEISKDKKHLRQGQVLDVSLDACMYGAFNNNMNVVKDTNGNLLTDFHPICYPPTPASASGGNSSANRMVKSAKNLNKFEISPMDNESLVYDMVSNMMEAENEQSALNAQLGLINEVPAEADSYLDFVIDDNASVEDLINSLIGLDESGVFGTDLSIPQQYTSNGDEAYPQYLTNDSQEDIEERPILQSILADTGV